MKYKVFVRNWWRYNPSWPNCLEPHLGRKTTLGYCYTEEEAQRRCEQYNSTHKPGKLSRKAEYTSDF